MILSLAGWSPIGLAALFLIVAGIILLVAYALRRGLHHRELEGMDPEPDGFVADPSAGQPSARHATRTVSRTMGAAGAAVLVLGLGLGVIAATGGWGTTQAAGPGTGPDDCALSWDGCPQATPRP